jgi:hypothetical protein
VDIHGVFGSQEGWKYFSTRNTILHTCEVYQQSPLRFGTSDRISYRIVVVSAEVLASCVFVEADVAVERLRFSRLSGRVTGSFEGGWEWEGG